MKLRKSRRHNPVTRRSQRLQERDRVSHPMAVAFSICATGSATRNPFACPLPPMVQSSSAFCGPIGEKVMPMNFFEALVTESQVGMSFSLIDRMRGMSVNLPG